jgi:5-methyltetrahydrofolate--homocysteine methyltransferase
LRERHAAKQDRSASLTLAEARANRFQTNWAAHLPPTPRQPGIHVLNDYPLAELAGFIDWTPFFATWELAGKYPRILDDEVVGKQARQLFKDAQAMLETLIKEKWLCARAVFGLFPANSIGHDDIEVYTDPGRGGILTTLHSLRQQQQKPDRQPNYALADFIAPRDSGRIDYIGAFAVTAGIGIESHVQRFEKDHDDYSAILLKALADRLAEAYAERLHQRVRLEFWGYVGKESFGNEELIDEKYRGIRPAPGYPACPDHTEKPLLWALLEVEKRTGIRLTENYAMYPAASVSGWYFSHPESRYFGLGRIQRDQVQDYAQRKGEQLHVMERWLAPNLGYEPDGMN